MPVTIAGKQMGCCRKNRRLQNTKTKFKRPPKTLEGGAIKFGSPPKENISGFTADLGDPTILRPEHPSCKFLMSQALLNQDGSASVLCLCMNPDSAHHGKFPAPNDCKDCPLRLPLKRSFR
jgi:hypothetical protein